jgi:hypothetical protein
MGLTTRNAGVYFLSSQSAYSIDKALTDAG